MQPRDLYILGMYRMYMYAQPKTCTGYTCLMPDRLKKLFVLGTCTEYIFEFALNDVIWTPRQTAQPERSHHNSHPLTPLRSVLCANNNHKQVIKCGIGCWDQVRLVIIHVLRDRALLSLHYMHKSEIQVPVAPGV